MIKAVLFDYGGVLSDGGHVGAVERTISKLCDRPVTDIKINDLHRKLLAGDITEREYFDEINRRYPCAEPLTSERFLGDEEFFKRAEPIYDLAANLRDHNIRTGILSNVYRMSADKLRERGYYEGFDPLVLSYEVRATKPDPKIFEEALRKLGLDGDEVLFVDDQDRFKEVAESFGMHFIQDLSPEQTVRDVEALIRKENGIELS